MIINNRTLAHLYSDTIEAPLTPNHLVFTRMLTHSSSDDRSMNKQVFVEGEIQKLSRLMGHFWHHWRKECIVNLQEYQSTNQKASRNLIIKLEVNVVNINISHKKIKKHKKTIHCVILCCLMKK